MIEITRGEIRDTSKKELLKISRIIDSFINKG